METYLIIIDLDGTTLTEAKKIHPKTKEAIQKVSQLGHRVVISTGRPYYSSYHYYDELKLDTYIVNRNGSHIHHPIHGMKNHSVPLSKEVVYQLMNSPFEKYIVHFYGEAGNDLYLIKGNMGLLSGRNYRFNQVIEGMPVNPLTMFTVFVDNNHVEEITTFIESLGDLVAVVWHHGGNYPTTMIEVFPNKVDKVNGINDLCELYQIPANRTIAFGDELNDIEMLKYVEVGVAMKNANPLLKEVADVVLDDTNDEGGVGVFLELFFKLNENELS
jgi:5-amino-6-(5-phospho-D-ribitylamino)uracil phosphatase